MDNDAYGFDATGADEGVHAVAAQDGQLPASLREALQAMYCTVEMDGRQAQVPVVQMLIEGGEPALGLGQGPTRASEQFLVVAHVDDDNGVDDDDGVVDDDVAAVDGTMDGSGRLAAGSGEVVVADVH